MLWKCNTICKMIFIKIFVILKNIIEDTYLIKKSSFIILLVSTFIHLNLILFRVVLYDVSKINEPLNKICSYFQSAFDKLYTFLHTLFIIIYRIIIRGLGELIYVITANSCTEVTDRQRSDCIYLSKICKC